MLKSTNFKTLDELRQEVKYKTELDQISLDKLGLYLYMYTLYTHVHIIYTCTYNVYMYMFIIYSIFMDIIHIMLSD